MKVIVPLDEQAGQSSKISEHFGSAPFMLLLTRKWILWRLLPMIACIMIMGSAIPLIFSQSLVLVRCFVMGLKPALFTSCKKWA